jgi:hypothetical protein
MELPELDQAFLQDRGLAPQITTDAKMLCLVFARWQVPPGYDRSETDLLLRLPAGYPDIPPDMWWCAPGIRLADGQTVRATEHTEHHLGRAWQRWSRHFENGQWKSGVDGLESFLALIRRELERCAGR